jgi:pimeloyl-ACP methyl ester carboxylesterase
MAGTDDRIADAQHNSVRLHEEIRHSDLRLTPKAGHMIHHLIPSQIMAAVDTADMAAEFAPAGRATASVGESSVQPMH